MKFIKEDLRVIWKTNRTYTQYPKEIYSEVREFDFSGRVAGRRFCRSRRRRESEVIEIRDRGKQWATGGNFRLQCREYRSPYADLHNPALGLHRESRRQAQEPAEADQGVREFPERAGNSVSGVSNFLCQYISL